MKPRQITIFRVCAEIIIAAAIGHFIALRSSWWDLDKEPGFCPIPALLIVGLSFGMFGRSPILLIGPVMVWSGILGEILDIFRYGFSAGALEIFAFLCVFLATVVLAGAATGRTAKRLWIKRRLTHAA